MSTTIDEWVREGQRLFGNKVDEWRFTCPSCGHVQTRKDFLDMGLPAMQLDWYLAFTCIGHFRQTDRSLTIVDAFELDQGYGCRYQGGLEPNISPVQLETGPNEIRPTFGFQPEPCGTCYDDRVICSRCELRVIDCTCATWDPSFNQKFKDCDDCQRKA